jgi:hypothetical protein
LRLAAVHRCVCLHAGKTRPLPTALGLELTNQILLSATKLLAPSRSLGLAKLNTASALGSGDLSKQAIAALIVTTNAAAA